MANRPYYRARQDALQTIAAYWRRPIECMWDLTPALPTMHNSCHGRLQLDHIRGGGCADYRSNGNNAVYREIRDGKRDLNDFRILCQRHNRWGNTREGRKIQRGDILISHPAHTGQTEAQN